MISKKQARKQAKTLRAALTTGEVTRNSLIICNKLISHPEFIKVDTIYMYTSINNEVDTDVIINKALELGKTVALPKVDGETMNFFIIKSLDEVTKGYMGIREPDVPDNRLITVDSGLIIVPGVAFDRKHNRTGYGKGYYDRFLANSPKIYKVGLAHSCQIFDEIEADMWDIPLDVIMTEEETI